jgi:hypothetical protein
MGRYKHINQYSYTFYNFNLCGDAASEKRMPPKCFFACGREKKYETRYNKQSRLYRNSGALSNSIVVLCFAGKDICKQKTEHSMNDIGYRLFHF